MEGAIAPTGTGTGFADAKLSEILPAARVARFVRMTKRKGNRREIGQSD
jgi:primosomal protein N'